MSYCHNYTRCLFALMLWAGAFTSYPALAIETQAMPVRAETPEPVPEAGIQFTCSSEQLPNIAGDMKQYMAELGIQPDLYTVFQDGATGILRFTLATSLDDTSTLDFDKRPAYAIPRHIDWMPAKSGELRNVLTVSQKEILLALMQRGRLTEFAANACTIESLRDHVGIRQNIVAWAEVLEWGWPDGGAAKWNAKYWKAGSLNSRSGLSQAINDAFIHQEKYDIGCYTATKLVVIQGILDYYRRIKRDPEKASLVEARLLEDNAPLLNIEPGRMWSFEPGFDSGELDRPGKLMRITYGVAPRNFIPGDWSYFLNTDAATNEKIGYEGSNPIYLGRDRFVDYYNDHNHFYSFEEKIDEVYQWRNKVFSRKRDWDKVVALSDEDYRQLSRSPEEGGLLTTLRTTPYYFGSEDLPEIRR